MQPRLSVVVPIYNVEEFLEECLESIARQDLGGGGGTVEGGGLEAVLVDDGSTDASTRIAREFATRDPRFVYVRQPNAGLSAARNTGVRHANPAAEYLTFVDSDDIVPQGAYARMIASLDASGSDFASGNVWRLTERGRSQAWQYQWLTASRTGTHISRDLALLADRVAWNKVFRRAFWDRHGFLFPEGRLYEDTPVMIPAHFLASSVDVLSDHVYYWRVREGSITRRRTDVKGVRDRIAACAHVSAFLGEHAPELKSTYDASCLRDDFVYFLEGLPMGGPEYRAAFLADTAEFLRTADPAILRKLPVDLRVKWHLVRERRTGELIELLDHERRGGKGAFDVRGSVLRYADHPGVDGIPRELTRLGRGELPAVARLGEATWDAYGRLRIRGYAYVRNLEATRPAESVKAGLLKSAHSRGRFRRVPTRTVPAPEATERSGQRLHCYDLSGFEMTFDPEQLKSGGKWRPGNWLLGVLVGGHRTIRRAAVRAQDGSRTQSLVRDLGDGVRLVLGFSKGRLVLRVQEYAARVDGHRGDGGDVVFLGTLTGAGAGARTGPRTGTGTGADPRTGAGALSGPVRPKALRLTHPGAGASFSYPVTVTDDRFEVRVRLADLEEVPPAEHHAPAQVERPHGDRWHAVLELADGTRTSLAAVLDLPPGRYASGPGRELCATADDRGGLVVELTRRPVADRVAWTADDTLAVEGSAAEASWPSAELVLRHSGRDDEVTVPVELSGGRFRAVVAPGGGALREGRWYVFLREAGHGGAGVPVRVLASTGAELPDHQMIQGREFVAARRFGDRLMIEAGSVLRPAERGAYRRHRLRTEHYPRERTKNLRDAVLYFDGDSPRAVHEELVRRGTDVEHLWVTRDQQTRVPAGARGVEEHGAEWYEALARCRRVVTAGHLPDFFERREGQTVVQTWNGTPLKRIGTDLTDTLYADHGHLDLLPRLAAQWNVLVSPNRFATPHLGRALTYEGEVLEAGSPRNDVLFADDRQKVTERVRRELGLAPDKRIVLYAPTYRDHLGFGAGRFRYDPALDLRAAEQVLGDDHVLLVRKHPLTSGRIAGARAPFVRDVTAHPRTAELLLVADVLITDYSSLMFDFAHTGRPMLFHAYDLAHYRDTVRGFYLDFENRAPGPLLASTGEVVDALRDLDTVAARHADAYAAFREAYCDLDDGRAAARVADRLMR
ncbi:bifunctional glycosyltransferase/CDP-glycerol:glycerophosphate glycerophosphotransferase [Streptomyces lasiicapitis]|uniref:bifunctional glycosyltransferase/CDP-glycerol:glycerophosphate glycerophosphotransferase n=1 Tax=Streptomyces lasiicapitis TaxID=1923961 RepID=UPI0036CE7B5B